MDEQLYLMGLGLSLEEKVEKALATLRHYEPEALKRDSVNGYYLCDSYGKDSCVILELAKMSGVKFVAHHNHTTLDPPELIWFGRKHHGDTVVHKPKMPLLIMLANEKTTVPTRQFRWCCEEYKEGGGNGVVKIFGVRAAESARRKASWKVWTPHRQTDSWILNPILYWTDDNLWQFIRQRGMPYCELYDEGYKRLGCVGCPMAGDGRKRDFARWPKIEAAWQRAFQKFYLRIKGNPRKDGGERYWERFDSWQEMWQWWLEELPEPDDDDCQMGLF